ncbi:MAG: TIGR03936 family radical SAM-associated protein [Clostridiales bacterium]|jgi:radical SAM-linked protein|nr:TIGR03936 family radical SAM-associated protein [Clostridiales bacterium]
MAVKVLLQFSKTDKMKFIGHLDLLKLMQRAVNRAALPVAYSQGFNPHQKMSFAQPLPLGMEGLRELMELELMEDSEILGESAEGAPGMTQKLNQQMPAGLRFLQARRVRPGEKSAAALLAAARYEMTLAPPRRNLDAFLARENILAVQKTKDGVKETDIRRHIFALSYTENGISAVLACGSRGVLKPTLLAEMLEQRILFCVRTELYAESMSTIF